MVLRHDGSFDCAQVLEVLVRRLLWSSNLSFNDSIREDLLVLTASIINVQQIAALVIFFRRVLSGEITLILFSKTARISLNCPHNRDE